MFGVDLAWELADAVLGVAHAALEGLGDHIQRQPPPRPPGGMVVIVPPPVNTCCRGSLATAWRRRRG